MLQGRRALIRRQCVMLVGGQTTGCCRSLKFHEMHVDVMTWLIRAIWKPGALTVPERSRLQLLQWEWSHEIRTSRVDRLPARPDVRMQRRRKPCDRDTHTNVAETARFRTPRANGASNTLDDAPHRFQSRCGATCRCRPPLSAGEDG